VELPKTVQQPGGVAVTVLRNNLCYNKRLGGKVSAWKPRAETESGMQPSGCKTGNGPTTDGNRATHFFGSELKRTSMAKTELESNLRETRKKRMATVGGSTITSVRM